MAGTAVTYLGILALVSICEDECQPTIPDALLITGVGLVVWGTIDDIVTARRAVRAYNQRLHNVSLVPVLRRDTRSVGLALTAQF